jgi:hypothetical protein
MTPPLSRLGRPAALALAILFALGWVALFFLVLGSFELPLALVSLGGAGAGLALLNTRLRQPPEPEERLP